MALRTTKGAAERLDVSESWLNHARLTGRGPRYVKLGHLVRYTDEALDEYIQAQTRTKVWDFGGEAA